MGGRGLRVSVCAGLGFRDYSLFGEKKHPHVRGLLGKLPLALLKQGALHMRTQPAARKGSLSRSRQGVCKLPKTRAGFAGIVKATTDLQGALFSFLCTLTIEIRNYRCGPLGSRREVL